MRRCATLALTTLFLFPPRVIDAQGVRQAADPGTQGGTRLLRHPAIHRQAVAFAYAGDLWIVPRTGGQARRLTATADVESDPRFSPDGAAIAFTRTAAGNTDVWVVATAGGEPKRLTYHPALERAQGWTADGKRVIFASNRSNPPHGSFYRIWTVPADGGFEEALPMPRAWTAVFSPDGRRIAYEEVTMAMGTRYELSEWRHYRGGRTHPIRVMNLADFSVEKLPWQNSNDSEPMWIGNTIYFLSDRNHTTNLFSYRTDTKELRQLTNYDDFDIKNASAGGDAIVYEQAGYVHLFDVASGRSTRLTVNVVGDLPWARPQFKRVASMIREFALSPTGVRVAFAARGDIFTVPVERGDYRNLTRSTGVHDRSPAWSPDGNQLAWLSDASGEYQLMLSDQTGLTKPRAIALPAPAFYSDPDWSPNGRQLLLRDNHLNLWTVDVASGRVTKVDSDVFETPSRSFDAVWSPDSRWIAYTKSGNNHLRSVFVYSVADGKSFQLTDALADAISPTFDASGKYLYFLASNDIGPRTTWLEMSQIDRPLRRSVYLTVLNATDPSPLLPEIGDEPVAAATPATGGGGPGGGGAGRAAAPAEPTRIDTAGIRQRILSLNVPAADLSNLTAGPAGIVFYTEAVPSGQQRLQRYQLRERTATTYMEGVGTYAISADRKKLLYRAGGGGGRGGGGGGGARWGVVATDRPTAPRVGDGAVDVADLEAFVDPRAEWAEIFQETWRTQRDFFYDERMHGANWPAVRAKYAVFLPYVGHRADLSYIIAQTGGELAVGHSYISGSGDVPSDPTVSVGMLGADYAVENGRYRIKRILTGENWNPDLRAPLSAPGIRVSEGDYLLEVNGRPVLPSGNVYQYFEGTAGRQTVIRINGQPSVEGSRLVTVVPVANEDGLRMRAWVEDNRRRVDSLSGGKLAYVWLPNTTTQGYAAFTRYFYAQQDKEGAIIDERYNQGGMVADYIVSELDRRLMGHFAMRSGEVWTSPAAGIWGPKVMIINESAGSGGDALPYMFRQRQLGPLVGTRTWGGLVGTLGIPATIDGGGITAPTLAFYDKGRWAVENEGVPPDIEVEYSAPEVIRGRDPQLERAVQEAMRLLRQRPAVQSGRPAPIDRVSKP